MRADVIASQGKTGKVSAMSVGSFGRLARKIGEILVVLRREIFEGYSRITKAITFNSRIDS